VVAEIGRRDVARAAPDLGLDLPVCSIVSHVGPPPPFACPNAFACSAKAVPYAAMMMRRHSQDYSILSLPRQACSRAAVAGGRWRSGE
ncbi:MAG: hypothetical protein ACK2U2_22270, partial [Anaerolineae bacterium]